MQGPVVKGMCKIYLVSNKHVLCDAESIKVSFSEKKESRFVVGGKTCFCIPKIKKNIVPHKDPNVDIAILDCTTLIKEHQELLYYISVPYEMLATFDEPELSVAENVNFIGYPDGRYDQANNLPLIRTGLIASHPKFDYNGTPVFIIDAQVFPGSSGSPVFIDLNYENFKNGKFVIDSQKIKLLGIVSATMLIKNKLQSVQTEKQFYTEEVLGLGIVYKATAIKALIDSMPIY